MAGFIGEYEATVDAKGRFLLPGSLRRQVPEEAAEFVLHRGLEPHLNLYTAADWNVLTDKINQLNDLKPQVRQFKRLFYAGASPVELDSAGRLLIPKSLKEAAGIEKDITLTSVGNRVEIWSSKSYQEMLAKDRDQLSALADEIGGDNFISPFS